jgi:hypothetical protein
MRMADGGESGDESVLTLLSPEQPASTSPQAHTDTRIALRTVTSKTAISLHPCRKTRRITRFVSAATSLLIVTQNLSQPVAARSLI